MPTVIFNAATAVVTRKSPYFVRTSQTIPQVTVPIAQWAFKNGVKRVITAVSDYAPGYDAEQYFVKTFKAAGGEVLEFIRIPLATTDFSPFYERVLQQKPDALFIFGPGGPPTVGMINTWASRLKPAGIKLLCTAETQEIDLPKIGPAALGVVSAFHYTETVDNPLNKALWADLTAMFGKNTVPDLASVGAYDAMELIYRAVAKFGPQVTGDEAIGFWRGMALDSPRGPIKIDENDSRHHPECLPPQGRRARRQAGEHQFRDRSDGTRSLEGRASGIVACALHRGSAADARYHHSSRWRRLWDGAVHHLRRT